MVQLGTEQDLPKKKIIYLESTKQVLLTCIKFNSV